MRPFNVKLLCCFGLLAGLAIIVGCGSSDLLDPLAGNDYLASISLTGGDGDAPNDLEVFASADCDGNATTDDPEPGLAGIVGTLTIQSSADAPFLQIRQYRVDYIPQQSPLIGGGTDLPPALEPPETVEQTINVQPNGTVSAPLNNIMTIDTKLFYAFDPDGLGTFAQGIYVIRVTLYGEDENNQSVTLPIDTVVRMMDIDNCD